MFLHLNQIPRWKYFFASRFWLMLTHRERRPQVHGTYPFWIKSKRNGIKWRTRFNATESLYLFPVQKPFTGVKFHTYSDHPFVLPDGAPSVRSCCCCRHHRPIESQFNCITQVTSTRNKGPNECVGRSVRAGLSTEAGKYGQATMENGIAMSLMLSSKAKAVAFVTNRNDRC